MPLKRLSFWDNSRLLTPYDCPDFIFVSEAGPGVRTVTRRYLSVTTAATAMTNNISLVYGSSLGQRYG